MTGFFPASSASRPSAQPSRFDLDMAKQLMDCLAEIRRLDGCPKAVTWAEDFRRLRRHRTEDEIKAVMAWFCKHAKDRYTPAVFSASSFREHFPRIVAAMERGTGDWDTLPDVEISDFARKISVQYLGGLNWPGDEKRDELKAIQISLDAHRDFFRRLRAAKLIHPRRADFIDHLVSIGGDPGTFVECWFIQLHRTGWTSEYWKGKLARHTISTQHKKFRRVINDWCQEYYGEGDHWHVIEELIGSE